MALIQSRIGVLAYLLCVVALASCGRSADPTPTPTATAALVSEATATATPVAVSPGQNGQIVATIEPVNATPVADGATASSDTNQIQLPRPQAPVVVQDAPDCTMESNLDLAGYPDLEATMGCAIAEAQTDPVGFNEFGDGPNYDRFMLWLSWEDHIYVLSPTGLWQNYPDTWQDGDPTYACNPAGGEPSSPPLPRRGFGKLWCEDPVVQNALGYTDVEERLCQHTVTQTFENGRVIACFEDASIRYFKIYNNQQWEAVLQP